jgi:hypothetical protein
MRFHVACKACEHTLPESLLWVKPDQQNHPLSWWVGGGAGGQAGDLGLQHSGVGSGSSGCRVQGTAGERRSHQRVLRGKNRSVPV